MVSGGNAADGKFLELIRHARRGKFKIYIGLAAGVGKTYRMLQEAHALLAQGVDVVVGYVETHNRKETVQQLEGLPVIPRKAVFYKGRSLEEMDVPAILQRHPEMVVVDELAHTNVPGSAHEKRWQDVVQLLEAGIHVISAVNIQHLESLNQQVEKITGVEVTERVPDSVLRLADEVVNIDLTIPELLERLQAGKIYEPAKVEAALKNFFQKDHLLQLRELALREVANQLERQIDTAHITPDRRHTEKLLTCIGTNAKGAREIIRKSARLADRYHAEWYLLYVQTSRETSLNINLATQRHLLNNLQLATELGAQVLKVKAEDVAEEVLREVNERQITLVTLGITTGSFWQRWWRKSITGEIISRITAANTETDIYLVNY
ncbi:sensor protein KdpD [Rufibacter quisquiliarum]|uniref:Two-component system sensor histidine kinase KdpD n=1 Tax=Rufibacter quisquiliarum TaxID=1549639 RepID=A0A839GFX3_9BACT|nr:sensor protein KdpD [Rufibacter quisquiliarum]MBA9077440.1 two-component system sensor histidine kinase KdpD [Rufibacter quisquiliarum]